MVKKLFMFIGFLALVAIIAIGFYTLTINVRASVKSVQDTPDEQAITRTLEQAYYLEAVAARTFDISKFPEVFIDSTDFNPSDNQKAIIENVFGTDAAQSPGYLTYMKAYYLSWQEGSVVYNEEIMAYPSPEEIDKIIASNQGKIIAPARKDPIEDFTLTYRSITIEGDRAVVLYDSPSAYREAILVKVDGKWFMASIRILKVHV